MMKVQPRFLYAILCSVTLIGSLGGSDKRPTSNIKLPDPRPVRYMIVDDADPKAEVSQSVAKGFYNCVDPSGGYTPCEALTGDFRTSCQAPDCERIVISHKGDVYTFKTGHQLTEDEKKKEKDKKMPLTYSEECDLPLAKQPQCSIDIAIKRIACHHWAFHNGPLKSEGGANCACGDVEEQKGK